MKNALIIAFILSSVTSQAQKQETHITYKQNFTNDQPSILTHKIFFTSKHALSYDESYHYLDAKTEAIVQTEKAVPSNVVIYNKHNKRYKPLYYTHFSDGILHYQIDRSWKPIKNRVNAYTTGSQIDLYISLGMELNGDKNDTIPNFHKTKNKRKIGKYNCKAIEYSHFGKSLTIWYTNEIQINWANLDFKNKIPGMIVLIEDMNGKAIFELINVQKLDTKNILFTNEDLNNIILEYEK